MKSISRLIFSLAIIAFAFTGCNEDDFTGQSPLVPTVPNPGITLTALPMNVIMEEKDTTMEFTFSMSSEQAVDVSINITLDEASTATAGEDFELSTATMVIPAFTTSASFELTIFGDELPEAEDETIIVHVGDNTVANAEFTPQTMSITLTNYQLETMDILIDWEGEFEFAGMTFPICPNVDIDPVAFAENAGTFSLSDDWGACPEQFSFVGDNLPTYSTLAGSNIVWGVDSYFFQSDLYSNGLFGYGLGDIDYPITVTISRTGVTLPFQYLQRMDQWFNGDHPGYAEDGVGTSTGIFVLDIEAGNVYKFYDPVSDDLILTSRMTNAINEARRVKALDFPGLNGELVQ